MKSVGIRGFLKEMDGLHLPAIVELRERSERCSGGVMNKNNITQHERLALAGRRQTNSVEKRRSRCNSKSTGKKRVNKDVPERTSSLKKTTNSGKIVQPKTQNMRKRFENIGLPKITTSNEENTLKSNEASGAKKARRTRLNKGDTISYVYSKSLQDENTMAFLRNSVEFEKDLNTSHKDTGSSFERKKPYGLPALKLNEENEREKLVNNNRELNSSDASETESLLNAWEAIDDEESNETTSSYRSTDCSTGNDD